MVFIVSEFQLYWYVEKHKPRQININIANLKVLMGSASCKKPFPHIMRSIKIHKINEKEHLLSFEWSQEFAKLKLQLRKGGNVMAWIKYRLTSQLFIITAHATVHKQEIDFSNT